MKEVCFCIAERKVEVSLPCGVAWERLLPSFVGFEDNSRRKPMCRLGVCAGKIPEIRSSGLLLTEIPQGIGGSLQLYEMDGVYIINWRMSPDGENCRMICNADFTQGYAYIGRLEHLSGEALKVFLMMLFAQSGVLCRTFLIHASVITKDGKGYAFLGKSGTGKSTHSSLWLRHIEGAELLNDDNPAIGVAGDGKVYVYGTPWSGKTPCYKNEKVELAALVRLQQAPQNRFLWKSGGAALVALLPSCSSMRWDNRLFVALGDLQEEVVRTVPVGSLQCLPDAEAARICYDEIIKKQK